MKHAVVQFLLVCCLLLVLPDCVRVIDWGKRHISQGTKLVTPEERVRTFIRSAKVYDRLSTCALFDVLWLADVVREAYVEVHVQKFGKSDTVRAELLKQEYDDSQRFVSFYVCAYMPLNTMPLGDVKSRWSVLLDSNGVLHVPVSVKSVELTPEYAFFLADVLSRYKTVYYVKFDRHDTQGNDLLTAKELRLVFRSEKRSAAIVWPLHEQEK